MLLGISTAVAAGIMLGLYALPEKYAKDFEFENTWGSMFFMALFIIPLIAGFALVQGFGSVLGQIPSDVYLKMGLASILWGVGVMMWGKAINYIGLSLGFSIFIGTVILVGSLLPFLVDGLPPSDKLTVIMAGILVVLVGVIFNGRAGMAREADGGAMSEPGEENAEANPAAGGNTTTGIIIAIVGGLLATGFSYANAAGVGTITDAVVAAGNETWTSAIVVMFVIYVAGGLFVVPYFLYQLSTKNLWGKFKTPRLGKNLGLTGTMALLNFAASAAFAYAAYQLGDAGNTVGYAIFNTVSVCVAGLSGYLAGEWTGASARSRRFFGLGIGAMVLGVLVLAYGGSL